jgi:hypothetical protein
MLPQTELAIRAATTTSVISRLEDDGDDGYSLATLRSMQRQYS